LSYNISDIPSAILREVGEQREKMMETLAEVDDGIAEKYLEEEDIPKDEIISAIRKATLSLKIVPVMCGAALRNKGIQPVLDAVVRFLPSPEDILLIRGINPVTGEEETRHSSNKEPLAALAFKIMQEEGSRKLAYLRIYSGQIHAGEEVYNASIGKREKVARLLKMHANKRERVEQCEAGDIIAVIGLKNTTTGDTICDESHPILLETIEFYEPVISQAVEAKTPADQERLSVALSRLMEEDPTIKVKYEEQTGQTIVSGMGELHLEIMFDRMTREFNAHINIGRPRVVYKETIQKEVEVEGRFEKELGEKRHFGHVRLSLEPLERGRGIEIIKQVDAALIPEEFLPAIEEGILESTQSGVVEGYPVVDCRISIVGGSFREGESTALGYKVAASSAFKNGCREALPVLLEPIMMVNIITPAGFTGEVISDINVRKGEIQSILSKGTISEIRAKVPLKAMFGYSTDLRSATQGRAVFTMHFSGYDHR